MSNLRCRLVVFGAALFCIAAGDVAQPKSGPLAVSPGQAAVNPPNTHVDLADKIPYQVGPIAGADLIAREYDQTFDRFKNVFQRGSFAKALGSAPVVALFGEGEAAREHASAWGGNLVGVCSVNGTTCWGLEIDIDDTSVAGGNNSFGLDVHSSGSHTAKAGLQFYANNPKAGFKDLIRLNAGRYNPVDLSSESPGGIMTIAGKNFVAKYGLNWTAGRFQEAELDLPSLRVEGTPSSLASRVSIAAGTTATGAGAAKISVVPGAGGASGKRDLLIAASGQVVVGPGPLQLPSFTVATLPPCSAPLKGAMAAVTDATAPTYNGALAGNGDIAIPVFCTGSIWTAH